MTRPALRRLVLVLGDQLDAGSAAFDGFDAATDAVWMAEAAQESTHVWAGQAAHRVVPRRDAPLCPGPARARPALHYARLDDADAAPTLADALGRDIARLAPAELVLVRPGDWRVLQALQAAAPSMACRWNCARTATSTARPRLRAPCARPQVAAHGVLLPRDARATAC
jgi:deoxyribodipyrimidine photolyase-related protein